MYTSIRAPRAGNWNAAILRMALWGTLLALTFAGVVADAITLTAVQSRKTHGANNYDLTIDKSQSIGGAVTVESRAIGGGHQIVFQFDEPVTTIGVPTAVDEAGDPVGSMTTPLVAGNIVTVTLTGVPDNKRVTIRLVNVNGSDFSASLGFLVGDVNNSRAVSPADIAQVKARSGQVVDATNFRHDLNASGAISASDVSSVKGRSGRGLPTVTVNAPPPDPSTVAPPTDPTVATDIATATEFLYTGANPIQTGVAPGTIVARRAAVLRGKVTARDGSPIATVKISILGHSELGQTLTRADGAFDLAVNGGGQLTVNYQKTGFLPVQRAIVAPWRDYAWLPDVVMIPFDTAVTAINLSGASAMQTARGNSVTDTDGTRRATILFPSGTTATMMLPNGTTQPLTTLGVRATEYTVGDSGPKAMPAPLPLSTGYTYAAEFSVDEAIAAGATEVRFSQALPVYVENFLGFPAGTVVPSGYYDRQKGQWIASVDGRVIKILGITNNLADLDTDGDDVIDDATKLTALGVTVEERTRLAELYLPGQTLWRVPIAHFTPCDFNMRWGPPPDAIPPPGPNPTNPPVDPCITFGSAIGCESQSLGESLAVTGTPWRMHYQSERTPGRKEAYTLEIPVSGAAIPSSLESMSVSVTIAGRMYAASFAAAPNVTYTVIWDGLDSYGRRLQGAQIATMEVTFHYTTQYYRSFPFLGQSSFGSGLTGTFAASYPARAPYSLTRTWTEKVGAWTAPALGLGGWSPSVQHAYAPATRTLLLGDGRQRRADALTAVITTVAGGGFGVDGGPATAASLGGAFQVAAGPDGSLYIVDGGSNRIRRVGPDGIISNFAGGNGNVNNAGAGFSGDGGPATASALDTPNGVAMGPDGSVFIVDFGNGRIRRVGPDGIITTIAGIGPTSSSGDGGPATAAGVNPFAVGVGPDGSVFISDIGTSSIRRVGSDGIISTFAGNGTQGFSGDGGQAKSAALNIPNGIAVGPNGSVFIADTSNRRIRRVTPDGIINTVAGDGTNGFGGDGGPAELAALSVPRGVAVGSDGSLFFGDSGSNRVRRVGADGIITTVAGNGVGDSQGDGGPAMAAAVNSPRGVAVGPDGGVFIGGANFRVRHIGPALPDFPVFDMLLASEDGREVYVFNIRGRHLRTLDALTGATRFQFGYDASGYLVTITDVSGNVTTIERIGAAPTAIVAPGGQRTTLATNADGWLVSATNPAAETHNMTYSTDGLMQTFIDPRGNTHRFTYDAIGRLIKDEDPVGGFTSLARARQSNGYTVTTTSALGQIRTFQVEQLFTGVRRSMTQPSGARTVMDINTDGSQTLTYPDGTVVTSTTGPDPRFGMMAPRLVKRVRTVPGGLTENTTTTRTVSLTDPNNPLTLQSLTDSVSVNGRTFGRSYNATTRTMTDISAESRQTVSVLNVQGRVISRTPAPGIAPITATYDAQGRVTESRQGTQYWTYGYDARNRVVSRTDAAGRIESFVYDNADRITQKTLPGGEIYQFTYDANGNRTAVIPPSGASHVLAYSAIDLDTSYTPPGNGSYLRTYNVDRQLTRTTLPAGRFTDQGYDTLGRVNGLSYAEGTIGFDYLAADLTDRVAGITNTPVTGPAQNIAYSYTGSLISGMIATGAAPAQVSYSYDNNFFPTAMNLVSGADSVSSALLWDKDGLVKGFGPFTFTRGGPSGVVSQISDIASNTSYTYDTLARIATRNHQVNALPTYAKQLSYDTSGRIIGKTETAGGATHTYAYAYDLNGQLIEVQRDSVVSERYTYDLNGNRTSRQLGAGTLEASNYDSQDRLSQRGGVTYQFNADGFLTQRGADTFQYNARGRLLGATVGAQPITYAYDGLGRRVSRTDGSGTYRYLYGDPASHLITAARAPSGVLTAFFYNPAGQLIALDRAGARYYVATDQVGSPRVVSSSTGTVVKNVEYDSFGNVTFDSAPAFDLPIGYAGGLADTASGLVHFGFRDYDPVAGRWTARDPALFGAGQGNLYVYTRNSPVDHRDPSGLFCVSVTAYEGVGGGVGFCITEDGASVCAEVGFGVGASVGVDPGGDLEETGTQLVAELAFEVGPVEISAEVSLSGGCLKATPKTKLGPVTIEPNKTGLDVEVEGAPKIGGGAEAKIAAKGCIQGKF